MYNALTVNIAKGTCQFCHPEADGFFCECFALDVESKVASIHQIHYKIKILDILEAVAKVAQEGVVQMFEHASFANDVANTFGAHH